MNETRGKTEADVSLLHSLNSVVKLLCFDLSIVTVLCARTALAVAVAVAYTAAVVYLSQLDAREVRSAAKKLAPLLLLIFCMNALFAEPSSAKLRFLIFSPSLPGAEKGLYAAARAFMLVLLFKVMFYAVPIAELTGAFAYLLCPLRLLKIPTGQAAFILAAAVDFIPFLLSETEKFSFARKTKAAAEGGGLIAKAEGALRVFIPTLLSAVSRAEKLSLSMEARGGSAEKTYTPNIKLNNNDIYALLVCFAVFIMQFVIL